MTAPPSIRVKLAPAAYSVRLPSAPLPALLDLSGRFAPKPEEVRAVLEKARAALKGNPDRLGLLWAIRDAGNMSTSHHATRLLCRVGGFPSLPNWLDAPMRTRREVLAVVDRALRCFGVRHAGGWRVSFSSPPQEHTP